SAARLRYRINARRSRLWFAGIEFCYNSISNKETPKRGASVNNREYRPETDSELRRSAIEKYGGKIADNSTLARTEEWALKFDSILSPDVEFSEQELIEILDIGSIQS